VTIVEFGRGVFAEFETPVPTGATFIFDPHDEHISFGVIPDNVQMLPHFYDIESSLPNDTFDAVLTMHYEEEELTLLSGREENDVGLYFNPETDEWEVQETMVDILVNTASFRTNHFSRYALGVIIEPTLEELFKELEEEVVATDINGWRERLLLKRIKTTKKLIARNSKGTQHAAMMLVHGLYETIDRYERKVLLSEEEASKIRGIIEEITEKLKTKIGNSHKKYNGDNT